MASLIALKRIPRPSSRLLGHPPTTISAGVLLLAILLLAAANAPRGDFIRGADARQPSRTVPVARPPATQSAVQSATVTRAAFSLPPDMRDRAVMDPVFRAYYDVHDGSRRLGRPITPALPTASGLVQFFEAGALLLPSASSASSASSATPDSGEAEADAEGGIRELPLLDDLLRLGSTAPVAGDASTLDYADLRTATRSTVRNLLTTPPAGLDDQHQQTQSGDLLAPAGETGTVAYGHTVTAAIWGYVTAAGQEEDFGLPLTNPLVALSASQGSLLRGKVQVFARGALLEDDDDLNTDGVPEVRPLATGVAYLQTVGLPPVVVRAGMSVWTTGETVLATRAAGKFGSPHLGANVPLRLLGDSGWADGTLWYAVAWQVGHNNGRGWVASPNVTHLAPPSGRVASLGFDALSPDLLAYLEQHGASVGVVVYDVTRGDSFAYNGDGQFTVASSVKVPIMLALLTMTERQGREPNGNEMALLTAMIEHSDNDAAQALWQEIGGGPALQAFMGGQGIAAFHANPDAWGWSTISPSAMMALLTRLRDGAVLTPTDRALALSLMGSIEPEQRTGVGDTAPDGAQVAMKDGWVPAPDDRWAVNTSGIVTAGSETYIISVYSQHLDSLDEGWDIVRHVCAAVAGTLS